MFRVQWHSCFSLFWHIVNASYPLASGCCCGGFRKSTGSRSNFALNVFSTKLIHVFFSGREPPSLATSDRRQLWSMLRELQCSASDSRVQT